jgi:hypothetical protein
LPQEAKPKLVSCPRCGAAVEWTAENRFRPFCSERCKLIDLGGWASEQYRIPDPESAPAPEDGE